MAVSWGVEEVAQWLQSVSLGRYSSAFRSEEVDGEILFDLDREGCSELGVKGDDVSRLLSAISQLKSGKLPTSNATRDPVAGPDSFFAPPGSTPTKQKSNGRSRGSSKKGRGTPKTETVAIHEIEGANGGEKKKKKSTWGRIKRSATFSRASGRKAAQHQHHQHRRTRSKGGSVRRRGSTPATPMEQEPPKPLLSPEEEAAIKKIEDDARNLQREEQDREADLLAKAQQELARNTFSRSRGSQLSKDVKRQQAAGRLEQEQLKKLLFMMTIGFNTRQERGNLQAEGKQVKPLTYQSALPGLASYHHNAPDSRPAIPSFDAPGAGAAPSAGASAGASSASSPSGSLSRSTSKRGTLSRLRKKK